MNVQYRIRDKTYSEGYEKYLTIEYEDEVRISVGTDDYSDWITLDRQQVVELLIALNSVAGFLNQKAGQ